VKQQELKKGRKMEGEKCVRLSYVVSNIGKIISYSKMAQLIYKRVTIVEIPTYLGLKIPMGNFNHK